MCFESTQRNRGDTRMCFHTRNTILRIVTGAHLNVGIGATAADLSGFLLYDALRFVQQIIVVREAADCALVYAGNDYVTADHAVCRRRTGDTESHVLVVFWKPTGQMLVYDK